MNGYSEIALAESGRGTAFPALATKSPPRSVARGLTAVDDRRAGSGGRPHHCGESSVVERPVLPGGGGAIPTSPLQLRKADWVVAGCDRLIAERFIRDEHYAKGVSNTATYLHALYPAAWHWYNEVVGIAWWIPPTCHAARALAGEGWQGVLALSRLAITPDTPRNACSFLLSKSVRKIDRYRWHTLVTYADKWRGHTGAIYLAAGWQYDGETKPERTYTLKGRMIARKAGPRTRTHAEMMAMGCVCEGSFAKSRFVLRAAA